MKRLIDCTYSEMLKMNKQEKLDSIRASEGRVILTETTLIKPYGMIEGVHDAEIAAAFGSDMILLNYFDVNHPTMNDIDVENEDDSVKKLKDLCGRFIGANLEPVDEDLVVLGQRTKVSEGRQASLSTAKRANELGLDYILLTGNPGTGVTNQTITDNIKKIHEELGESLIIFAGKMHAAGSSSEAGENIISKEIIKDFAEAGADVILIPAPGTVPGISQEYVKEMISYIHSLGLLAMTAIGTSQEGAAKETIRDIALMAKMCGADIHHIGDAGFGGLDPENIKVYSETIRGKRHTYSRMARSIRR